MPIPKRSPIILDVIVKMNQFPLSETIGVFLGISGFDWLSDGYPEPLKAFSIAVVSGLVLFLLKWARQH